MAAPMAASFSLAKSSSRRCCCSRWERMLSLISMAKPMVPVMVPASSRRVFDNALVGEVVPLEGERHAFAGERAFGSLPWGKKRLAGVVDKIGHLLAKQRQRHLAERLGAEPACRGETQATVGAPDDGRGCAKAGA